MRRWIDFRGLRIDVSRVIESVKPAAEKVGVEIDDMTDSEALFFASKQKNVSVPELLGFEK